MKRIQLLIAGVALLCGAAQAGTIRIGGVVNGANGKTSAIAGACSVLFNDASTANTCGATYTTNPQNLRQGSVNGQYAAPAGDSTFYLTVGPTDGTPVTVVLANPANYFGFFAGSLDTFNLVQFFFGTTMVDQFTGSQINAVAFGASDPVNGDQSEAQFIDYFTTGSVFYNRVVISSGQNAFETDSHAFAVASPVPEPASVALFGIGALALVARRRRLKAD